MCPVYCKSVRPISHSKSVCPIIYSKPIGSVNHCKPVRPISHGKSVRPINHSKPVHRISYSKPARPVSYSKPVRPVNHSKPVCSVYCKPVRPISHSISACPIIYIKPIRPVNHCKPIRPVSHSKPVLPVNHSKPVHPVSLSKPIRPVSYSKPVCPVNHSKPVCSVYCKPARPISHGNSACPIIYSKPIRPVNQCKPIRPISHSKPVRPVNQSKPIHPVSLSKPIRPVSYSKPVLPIRYLILISFISSFVVFLNKSANKLNIFHLNILMNFHMTFLIFKKYFKYIYIFDIFLFFEKVMEVIILIDYFIFIIVRVFKYLLLTILIICKSFFILFSILFMVRFAFTNIYINVTSNDNVNTILDGTFPVAFMAGVRIDDWQERFMSVSDTPKEDTESFNYIFRNYIILTLSYFFGNIFCKNKIINTTRLLLSIFIIFVSVYKFPSNQTDSDLKYCSNFEFYHAESVKLQDNLGIRNTDLAFFAISKLRNKPAYFLRFYQILLILSGDISLNPRPCQTQLNDDKTWDPLKTKGLHFCHLNVNSLLSKIDEIRDIANRIKPAVLGITESKLDSFVTNMEEIINGYSIIRNGRNRHGGGVACYVKNDLCFNTKKIFPNSIEHVFFGILIPKVKPTAVGIFYRPPNSNDFLNLLSNSFQQIDLNKKEIYLLGDFNINLFQNGKLLLKENQSNLVKDPTSSLISKYKELCQSFFLTEIIEEPTRTTCNTASLLDHILTNCAEKVSQKGVIDVGLSDHQLIFCTRKIRRTRGNMHNQIQTRSLRNYSAENLISTLKD